MSCFVTEFTVNIRRAVNGTVRLRYSLNIECALTIRGEKRHLAKAPFDTLAYVCLPNLFITHENNLGTENNNKHTVIKGLKAFLSVF